MKKQITIVGLLLTLATQWMVQAAEKNTAGPQDRAVKATADLSKRMEPSVSLARQTYPAARDRYLKGLPAGYKFSVVTRVYDRNGKWEQVFVSVDRIAAQTIHGRIDNTLTNIKSHKKGDALSFPETSVIDWCITDPQGTEEGNYLGKFLDAYEMKFVFVLIAIKSDATGRITAANFRTALTIEQSAQDVFHCIPEKIRRGAEQMLLGRNPAQDSIIVIVYDKEDGVEKKAALLPYDVQNEKLEPHLREITLPKRYRPPPAAGTRSTR